MPAPWLTETKNPAVLFDAKDACTTSAKLGPGDIAPAKQTPTTISQVLKDTSLPFHLFGANAGTRQNDFFLLKQSYSLQNVIHRVSTFMMSISLNFSVPYFPSIPATPRFRSTCFILYGKVEIPSPFLRLDRSITHRFYRYAEGH